MKGRYGVLLLVLLSLASLLLGGCGGNRPPEGGAPGTTEEARRPVSDEEKALPNLVEAYEKVESLPGYHFEGRYWMEGPAKTSFLHLIEKVDAEGNSHIVVYEEEGGQPVLEIYVVDGHTYMSQGGVFMDMGPDSAGQMAQFASVYMAVFQGSIVMATDLERVGHEEVNGIPATRYQARFDRWVATQLHLQTGVSYSAEGSIWIADEYGVIVKSEVQTEVTEEGQTTKLTSVSEISQVGQLPPIEPPENVQPMPGGP